MPAELLPGDERQLEERVFLESTLERVVVGRIDLEPR